MAHRRKALPRLAEGELELLQMLWREQEVTLQQAHVALDKPIGYTTVQTRLNRMAEKGLAKKSSGRPARYSAGVTREEVHARDLETLLDRVSDGRVAPLVAHLINRREVTRDEIADLKELVRQAEQRLQSADGKGAGDE